MEAAITNMFGIDRRATIKANRCPFCGGTLGPFRDELSQREASISGLCQKCQDETFGTD